MGLGQVNENNGVFLTIAGGYLWNRKGEETDPNYATQKYVKADKSEGERSGARYGDLSGVIKDVRFRTHEEYGENINVKFVSGEESYIISISTNNRYSQDMMKFLLVADLSETVFMKPYDFIDKKTKKRNMGLSFRQNGEKVVLKVDDVPTKDKEWFKEASKKEVRRFFEDLSEWFVAEVEEKVCSQFSDNEDSQPSKSEAKETEHQNGAPDPKTQEAEDNPKTKTLTPLAMRKAIRTYITENYPDQEMPILSKADLVKWYELVLEDSDLPFEDIPEAEVKNEALEEQLDKLIPKK